MAKSIRRAADRFHPAGMSGPYHRVESKIVTPHSAQLFCLLPTLQNTFSASQGRSGVENCSEARTRASRGNSSGGRTSPPLPASSRLGLVRRCPRSAIMASDVLPWSSNQSGLFASQDQISSRHQLVFALAALRARTPCSAVSSFTVPLLTSSVTPADREPLQTRFSVMTAPVGVQQKLMRHAHVSTTMDQYGNASALAKRKANRPIVQRLLQRPANQEVSIQ